MGYPPDPRPEPPLPVPEPYPEPLPPPPPPEPTPEFPGVPSVNRARREARAAPALLLKQHRDRRTGR